VRAARLGAGLAATAVAVRLVTGPGLVNYDTLYALVWGRDLASGTLPDYDVTLAPTPHPLGTLAGVLLAPLSNAADHAVHGQATITITLVLAFVWLALLGWITYRLGSEWFNRATGLLAAAIILTRRPVLDFGARAYLDIPYLVLVLGALLVETKRPRAGVPVLVLLAIAGLLRPEAWLFSLAYLVYLVWAGEHDRAALARLVAVAASGPVLWGLADLVVTGNPLHSLTGTRETAHVLERVTGLNEVPATMPRRLGEILREPVLFGAAGGGLLSLWLLRDRARLGAIAGLVAIAAFCVLAAAGLPILGRYLLLPATILAIFCGAGAFGWHELPVAHPWRQRWAWFGAATIVLLVVFVPAQVGRLRGEHRALARQNHIESDLKALVRVPGAAIRRSCPPVTVPNHRPVPLLALWLDVEPTRVVSAQERIPPVGTFVTPATPQVAKDYILDPRDLNKRIAPPPRGFRLDGANGSWRVFTRCA